MMESKIKNSLWKIIADMAIIIASINLALFINESVKYSIQSFIITLFILFLALFYKYFWD